MHFRPLTSGNDKKKKHTHTHNSRKDKKAEDYPQK